MAGLWSRKQQIQMSAWILVLSFLMHHCLASSMQQQPPMVIPASPIQWETSAEDVKPVARSSSPSLRNILRRSVATGDFTAADAAATVQLSHNLTNSNVLPHKPSATADAQHSIQNIAESLRTETESSGAKEAEDTEFIKVKPINIEPEEDRENSPDRTEQVPTGDATNNENVACPECKRQRQISQLDPETLRHIRIENIKRQILSKLKFEKPPNVTRNEMNIPAPLSEGQFGGTEEELIDFQGGENEVGDKYRYYGKTTQVIITAKDDLVNCPTKTPNAKCFEFDLTQAAGLYVLKAELWFYTIDTPNTRSTEHNRTIVVSQLASRHSRIKKELFRETVSLNGTRWLTFDMKHKVQNLINHSQRHQRLEIYCEDCNEFEDDFSISTKTAYKPFLSISTSEPSPRKPRSIDCGPGSTDCCRERFYVSFAEIGWDDWILQPKGYYANYCTGSCLGPVIPGYAHTSVIHGVIAQDKTMNEELTPCCSPKQTKGLLLLYYKDTAIYRKKIEEMIIESCACS